MTDQPLDFYFAQGRAGRFQTPEPPTSPGLYSYMPYRSGAHHNMGLEFRDSGFAECWYRTEQGVVRFKVVGIPAYGQLELAEFCREFSGPL